MHRAARSTVFAVIAAGAFWLADDARADFDQERQLYMLNRLELENAEAMLAYYQDKFAGTATAVIDLRKRKDARLNTAGCDTKKPGSIGICQRIEADYQAGIRIIATLREDVRVSLQTQHAQVERLREQFNTAVAKYVAAVESQAAILPAEREGDVKEPPPPNDNPPPDPAPQSQGLQPPSSDQH
jgi:hypothetical protein